MHPYNHNIGCPSLVIRKYKETIHNVFKTSTLEVFIINSTNQSPRAESSTQHISLINTSDKYTHSYTPSTETEIRCFDLNPFEL